MDISNIIKTDCDIDACLIISQTNRRYFTGFDSSDGYLLITKKQDNSDDISSYFFTDSRYIEKATEVITNSECIDSTSCFDKMRKILEEKHAKKIAIESEFVTINEFLSLKKSALKDFEFVCDDTLDRAINDLRLVKSGDELSLIKKAQQIAEKSFDKILDIVRPGISERELSLELDYTMLSSGAEALSFDTICASGKNSSMPHAVPTDKKLEIGDLVTMDFGAVVGGYHSDMTRTFFVGRADDEKKKIYTIVLEAQKNALDKYRAGLDCRTADAAARDVIEKSGYGKYFGHSTGHGVGIEIHEKPYVSPNSKEILQDGNVVSCEPGIYLPGKFGVRIEDIVVVRDGGIENLTSTDKGILIV